MNSPSPLVQPPVETAKQSKSPKSPKGALENPFLKSSSLSLAAPSLVPEQERSPQPIIPHRIQKLAHATPGPPPRASLSLSLKVGSISKEKPSFETHAKSSATAEPILSPHSLFSGIEETPVGGTLVDGETRYGHWVVAFGYTNDRECKELFSILQDYGRILSTKSSGNWVAVQFQDEVSAVRVSARQLLRVGSILCGISRTNRQLLQDLVSNRSTRILDPLPAAPSPSSLFFCEKPSSLDEEDILAGYRNEGNDISSARQHQKSICEKLFYWYFGWGGNGNKLHSA